MAVAPPAPAVVLVLPGGYQVSIVGPAQKPLTVDVALLQAALLAPSARPRRNRRRRAGASADATPDSASMEAGTSDADTTAGSDRPIGSSGSMSKHPPHNVSQNIGVSMITPQQRTKQRPVGNVCLHAQRHIAHVPDTAQTTAPVPKAALPSAALQIRCSKDAVPVPPAQPHHE